MCKLKNLTNSKITFNIFILQKIYLVSVNILFIEENYLLCKNLTDNFYVGSPCAHLFKDDRDCQR